MSTVLHELDDRFAMDEIISASNLQEKSVSKIKAKLKEHHKFLVTHYGSPVGVLLQHEVFTALLRRYTELEEVLEAKEASEFIDDRLSRNVPDDQWLTLDQFNEAASKVLGKKARLTDSEG